MLPYCPFLAQLVGTIQTKNNSLSETVRSVRRVNTRIKPAKNIALIVLRVELAHLIHRTQERRVVHLVKVAITKMKLENHLVKPVFLASTLQHRGRVLWRVWCVKQDTTQVFKHARTVIQGHPVRNVPPPVIHRARIAPPGTTKMKVQRHPVRSAKQVNT